MKQFASPGIDSPQEEFGVFNSGAGRDLATPTAKINSDPDDWRSNDLLWGSETGRLIGTDPNTKAPPANSLQIRKRGVSPFGGFSPSSVHVKEYKGNRESRNSLLNVGGSVDHNAGASSIIAGGKGAASSMVRISGSKKVNEGQKLPILPREAVRGAKAPTPSGGMHGMVSAPIIPQVAGFPKIVNVGDMPQARKVRG